VDQERLQAPADALSALVGRNIVDVFKDQNGIGHARRLGLGGTDLANERVLDDVERFERETRAIDIDLSLETIVDTVNEKDDAIVAEITETHREPEVAVGEEGAAFDLVAGDLIVSEEESGVVGVDVGAPDGVVGGATAVGEIKGDIHDDDVRVELTQTVSDIQVGTTRQNPVGGSGGDIADEHETGIGATRRVEAVGGGESGESEWILKTIGSTDTTTIDTGLVDILNAIEAGGASGVGAVDGGKQRSTRAIAIKGRLKVEIKHGAGWNGFIDDDVGASGAVKVEVAVRDCAPVDGVFTKISTGVNRPFVAIVLVGEANVHLVGGAIAVARHGAIRALVRPIEHRTVECHI
jgi:hypothetical protein